MSKKYRLSLMLLSLIILLCVGSYFTQGISFITTDFWFASGLLLLILLSLVDQPFFSKDSNIFVNGVTAALSLLLVAPDDGGADKNLDQNDGTGGNPCFHIKIE